MSFMYKKEFIEKREKLVDEAEKLSGIEAIRKLREAKMLTTEFYSEPTNLESLLKENLKLKQMLVNEHGVCAECVEAQLLGFTICGDCSCKGDF